MLNKLLRKMISVFRKINISSRLLISFTCICFIPIILLGVFSSVTSSRIIEQKVEASVRNMVFQVSETFSTKLDILQENAIDMIYQSEFQSYAKSISNDNITTKVTADLSESVMKKFYFESQISDIVITASDGDSHYSYTKMVNAIRISEEKTQQLLELADNNRYTGAWDLLLAEEYDRYSPGGFKIVSEEKSNYLIYTKQVRDLYTSEIIGYLLITVAPENFISLLNTVSNGGNWDVFVLNNDGEVFSIGPSTQQEEVKQFLEVQTGEKEPFFFENQDIVVSENIASTDLNLICCIPEQFIREDSQAMATRICVIVLCLFAIAAFFCIVMEKSIIKPLNQLLEATNQIKQGNFQFQISDPCRDELGRVSSAFNQMSGQLDFLFEEVKQKEKLKRKFELDVLQAQINPHFLSNTLNIILALAQNQKVGNIAEITGALITLMRNSMNKNSDFITIEEEINLVNCYVAIQKYKNANPVNVVFDIPETTKNLLVPKFTLEIFVENSVLYGPLDAAKPVDVIVRANIISDKLKLTVMDNGQGMSQEKIEKIFKGEYSRNRLNGIGIKNIDDRIKLYYGNDYGVKINSIVNEFTIVEILLPAKHKEEP